MKIIYKDGTVAECPQEEELHVIRHTAAHIMAQAIKHLFPEADFAYGPATQNGFYYDVDLGDRKLTQEDLEAIEKEMKKIVKQNLPVKSFILNREDSKKLMAERGEKFKLEHMDDLANETEFSFFQQGDYIDMCLGPHLTYTKALKAFKVTQQSGAYWKNDSSRQMLTRINGVAFRNAAAGGPGAGSPQDRPGDAALYDRRPGGPGTAHVPAQRRHHLGGAAELYRPEGAPPGLPARDDPLRGLRGALQDLRPLGAL